MINAATHQIRSAIQAAAAGAKTRGGDGRRREVATSRELKQFSFAYSGSTAVRAPSGGEESRGLKPAAQVKTASASFPNRAAGSYARRHRLTVRALALIAAFALSGCKEKGPDFEIVTLEGKVEKVDVNPDGTGAITVVYFSEKRNQDIVGTGTVTRNTEIMINGAVAKLEDVRIGEHVRGEVRIDKKGKSKVQTALKIYIDRARPVGGIGG